MQRLYNGDERADGPGDVSISHEVGVDSLGRMTKYVYDNPETGRAVAVVNCSHQFDQELASAEAEVKASLDFCPIPGSDRRVMKLSVVVMLRKQHPQCMKAGEGA